MLPSDVVDIQVISPPGLSFLSYKMEAVLLNEANKIVARFLFENKIISNRKYARKLRIYTFYHRSPYLLGILKIKAMGHGVSLGQGTGSAQRMYIGLSM